MSQLVRLLSLLYLVTPGNTAMAMTVCFGAAVGEFHIITVNTSVSICNIVCKLSSEYILKTDFKQTTQNLWNNT